MRDVVVISANPKQVSSMKKAVMRLLAIAVLAVIAFAGTFVSVQQGPPGFIAQTQTELDLNYFLVKNVAVGLVAAVAVLSVLGSFGGRLRRSSLTHTLHALMISLLAAVAQIAKLVLEPHFTTSRSVRT